MRSKGIITRAVLLLNADTSVLTTVSVKRAIRLYIAGKVYFLQTKEGSSIHPKCNIGVPTIICMIKYVHIPYRQIPLTRRNVLLRDNYICQYTGEKLTEKTATIDHIYPKSRKGSPGNTWTNLVACSKSCNNFKGDRKPEEVGLKLIGKPFTPQWEDLVLNQRPAWKDFVINMRNGEISKSVV